MSRRGKVAAACLWGFVLLCRPAGAEETKTGAAKRAFSAGNQAYDAGEYLAAARAYENAYEIDPLPSITFSAAQAYRRHYGEDPKLEWFEKARSLYQRYLEEQPSGGRRAHAVTHLGNIALLLAGAPKSDEETKPAAPPTELLVSSTAPHATASIDEGNSSAVPLVQRVTPGNHRVRVSAPGFFGGDVDVLAVEGRLGVVPVELKPRPGSLRVLASTESDVWVDGHVVASSPERLPGARAPFELPAGRHHIFVGAQGRRPVTQVVMIERGRETTIRADLVQSDQRRAAKWTLAGAGTLALVGVITGLVAIVSENEAKDARSALSAGRPVTPDEAEASNRALERRDLFRSVSIAAFGGAAAAGITGTLLFVFDSPAPGPTARDVGTSIGIRYGGVF